MMDKDTLRDYLEVLREEGASQFTCPEFSVTLLASKPDDEDYDVAGDIETSKREAKLPNAARGIFGHPSLYPNGVPPMFPGSERATPTHAPTHADEE